MVSYGYEVRTDTLAEHAYTLVFSPHAELLADGSRCTSPIGKFLVQVGYFYRSMKLAARASIVIVYGSRGRVGGNENVPLDAGSPKLAQRFVSTSILPEMMSLSLSGRLQSAIL